MLALHLNPFDGSDTYHTASFSVDLIQILKKFPAGRDPTRARDPISWAYPARSGRFRLAPHRGDRGGLHGNPTIRRRGMVALALDAFQPRN
jgi:hypothetical protein